MADVRRWVDGTGRVRWQPVTDDGYSRFVERGVGVEWLAQDYATSTRRPSLCRFRWWAGWLARRRERLVAKTSWSADG